MEIDNSFLDSKIFSDILINKSKSISLELFGCLFGYKSNSQRLFLQNAFENLKSTENSLCLESSDLVNIRLCAEKKATLNKSKRNQVVTLNDIYSCIDLPEEIIDELKQSELEALKQNICINPVLKFVLQYVSSIIKSDLYILSNSYYPKDVVFTLLKRYYPDISFANLYLSCEVQKSKDNGDLFNLFLEENALSPETVLHIGCDKQTDQNIPASLGIRTVLLSGDENESFILNKEKYFCNKKCHCQIDLNRKNALVCAPRDLNDKEDIFYYKFGAFIFGPVLVEFCRWVAKRCLSLGITRILSFAREGVIFDKILNIILNSDPIFKDISSDVLYASRKSVSIDSINESVKNSLKEQIDFSSNNNYTVYESLENLCIFNFDKNKLDNILVKDFIALYDETSEQYNIFSKYINDALASRNEIIKKKLQLISDYVDTISRNEKFAFVDLGGGGTIAKKLNSFCPSKAALSFLLFQTRRAYGESDNENQIETLFSSFFPFEEGSIYESTFAEYGYVIESLLMGTIGSTQWYSKEGNQVVPKLAGYFICSEHRKRVISNFEKGIMSYLYCSKHTANNLVLSLDDRYYLATILLRLCLCPTADEANIFGGLPFDENYDEHLSNRSLVLCNDKAKAYINSKGVSSFMFSMKYISDDFVHRKAMSIYWPAGTVTQIDKDFCSIIYSNVDYDDGLEKLTDNLIKDRVTSVSIYGAGSLCQKLIEFFLLKHIKINMIFDRKAEAGAFEKFGYTISPLTYDSINNGDSIVIASAAFLDEIESKIKFVLKEKSYKLYTITN